MNYRTPLPPISELAALASNIQTETSADGKVRMAISIWEEAQRSLDHFAHVQKQIEESNIRNHHEKIDKMNLSEGIKLTEFLKRILPSSKNAARMKWYRDYLRWTFSNYAGDREKIVSDLIEKERTEGITLPYFSAVGFLKYRDRDSENTRIAKASKGGKAKKNTRRQKKAAKKAPRKTTKAPSKQKRAAS